MDGCFGYLFICGPTNVYIDSWEHRNVGFPQEMEGSGTDRIDAHLPTFLSTCEGGAEAPLEKGIAGLAAGVRITCGRP